MILVLKINGFLRSIDKRIGNPLNNINIMVNNKFVYICKNLDQICLRNHK